MDVEKESFPRWLIVVLTAGLFILLVGGTYFYREQESTVRQQVVNEFTTIGHLKVNQIIDWRRDRLKNAAIMMENPFFRQAVIRYFADPKEQNTQELRSLFQSFATYGLYVDVLLTDPKGRVYLSLHGIKKIHSVYKQSLVMALRERKPVFTELHTEEKDPTPHISLVAPIYAGNEKDAPAIGAVVFINNAAQFLYPLLESWPTVSKTAETLLVRRDGNNVLFLNNLRHAPDAALKLRFPESRTEIPAVKAILGRKGIVEGKDYRGVEVMSLIFPVPDSKWFMVVKEDTAEIFHVWHSQAILILALFVALMGGLIAMGLIAWQRYKKVYYRTLYSTESKLRASVERQSITLNSVGDGVIATDIQGRVELMNPVAETLTGWSQNEASGRSLDEVFHIINENTREAAKNPVNKVLRDGLVVGLANHTLLISKNGTERAIADSAAPIKDPDGKITGVVLVFREQTEERRVQRLMQARLTLLEFAAANSLDAFLTKALDKTGDLVQSPIGFYHFVGPDQKTLSREQWSSRTLQDFCRTEGRGMHYSIDQAGVWVDCVHQKKPVIHNDYATLPHKKGLPEGHSEVIRELVVPIIRGEKVVAILGVGNKAEKYTEKDVEAVSYLADVAWQIIEKKRTDEMLQESEAQYRNLFENAPIGIFSTTSQGKVLSVNYTMANILGFSSPQDALDHYVDLKAKLYSDPAQRDRFLEQLQENGHVENFEYQAHTVAGRKVWLRMNARICRHNEDGTFEIEGFTSDVTAQHSIEAQLLQAQKMESVGRLAGGIAHDYNNMLNVILGYTEMALEKLPPENPLHGDLQQIYKAAVRSAEVTRQLLAFARKQTISPKVIDMNKNISGMLKMLPRLIGEDIDLEWIPQKRLCSVIMDPSQLDQILANLCVNARDAIAGVGKVTIETKRVTFDDAYCNDHLGFIPGDFAMFAVSDSGCGMDKKTQEKLFEPFFTTKKMGKGTGLGLATVYGIVKQNNGFINVYSELGRGTTFKIYIPCHGGKAPDVRPGKEEEAPLGSAETVLIVEDEIATLDLARAMLERLGYTVLTAATPHEAIRLVSEGRKEIALLITDVVMPEINGRDLAKQIKALCPGIKVLFMSGYTSNVIAHHGVLEEGVNFVQKPFSLKELAMRVCQALADSQ